MNFDLTPDQARAQETARRLASEEVEPRLGRIAELGLLDATDPVASALALEELAAGSPRVAAIVGAHVGLFAAPILRFGAAAQQAFVLSHDAALGCFAHAEGPHDDGAPMRTVASARPDGAFALTGTKRFVELASEAEHALVVAGSGPGAVALLVPMRSRGVSVDGTTITFDEVLVPSSGVVGADGLAVAEAALEAGRVAVAAQAIGIARGAFERAAAYLKERRVAAKANGADLQALEFAIADMAVEIDAARLLTLRAARALGTGTEGASGAIAKLFAAETAGRVTRAALGVFGRSEAGRDVERYVRAAERTSVEGGASESLRTRIAGLEA